MTTLKQLFLEPWTEGGEPLFASQAELAREVATLPDAKYRGSASSLPTFLNQILNNSRSCPAELRADLLAVAKLTAQTKLEAKDRVPSPMEVEVAIGAKLSGNGGSSPDLVTDLFLRQVRAREVVIINPSTLEGSGHPRAVEFQNAMVTALLDGTGRYTFILADQNEVESLEVRTRIGLQTEMARRKNSNASECGKQAEVAFAEIIRDSRLSIWQVDRSDCTIPIVAFDPSALLAEADVYVWDWSELDGTVVDNIIRLSLETKKKWIRDFYLPTAKRLGESRDEHAL